MLFYRKDCANNCHIPIKSPADRTDTDDAADVCLRRLFFFFQVYSVVAVFPGVMMQQIAIFSSPSLHVTRLPRRLFALPLDISNLKRFIMLQGEQATELGSVNTVELSLKFQKIFKIVSVGINILPFLVKNSFLASNYHHLELRTGSCTKNLNVHYDGVLYTMQPIRAKCFSL